MPDLDKLYTIKEPRRATLTAPLHQGGSADVYGRAAVFATDVPPHLRFTCDGLSQRDRPSIRAFDPDGQFMLAVGLDHRRVHVQLRLVKVESDDKAVFEAQKIVKTEQRREYFRVRADFTAQLAPADENTPRHAAQVVSCANLSGGGMLMHTEAAFTPGQMLRLVFHLPDEKGGESIECMARVVRCVSAGRSGGYYTAVAFEVLGREQLDAIMAFCFAKQREQLREQVRVRDFE